MVLYLRPSIGKRNYCLRHVCFRSVDGHAQYYDGWYHKAPEVHKSIGILL